MSTTFAPNKYIGEPAIGDSSWGITNNASLSNIDSAFGGVQTFNLASASGTVGVTATSYIGAYPANTASYIPLSWTLTGTLTANVTLQIPSGVGGKWIVNNQCTVGTYTITFAVQGGSKTATINSGVQIVYSDGLGNAYQSVSFPVQSTSTNRIINGDFNILQNGSSGTIAPNTSNYGPDQWQIGCGSGTGASLSWAQVSSPTGFSNGLGSCAQMSITGMNANTGFFIAQPFEAARITDLDSAAIAVSFDINATWSAGSLTVAAFFQYNTAIDNSTWSNSTSSISVSSLSSGVTQRAKLYFPSAVTSGLKNGARLVIQATLSPASAANVTLKIGCVQVEMGTVANAWAPKSPAQEWSDCERFFQTSYENAIAPGSAGQSTGFVHITEATSNFPSIQAVYRTKLRTIPTVTIYSPNSGASGKFYDYTSSSDLSASVYLSNSSKAFSASVSNVSVPSAHGLGMHWSASSRL